jgi:signal transduction histidine kinase
VVVNLLTNAVKFTPRGGQVTVRARSVGDRVRIAVEDDGVGVPAEDRERIFEEYAQSARTSEGTGLGLPLARRFVQLHGGSLWLHSRPGGGSIFQFDLPRRPANTANASPKLDDGLEAERDYSAFTQPGSVANRTLIGRIAYRVILLGALFTVLLALVTPWSAGARVLIAGVALLGAAVAGFRAVRVYRVSFVQVELFGWGSIVGITVLTAIGGSFADLVPFAYGFVTMISFALWVRSRAVSRLVAIAVCYGAVLLTRDTPDALIHWIAIMTVLGFNGEIVSWVTRRLRRLVVAEQLAHRGARQIRAELDAASRHKSTFIANMSHELRTPLNAVIGFADLLGAGLAGDLNDVQRDYIKDIQEAARHLLAIINDVLDAAKLDAGQMQLSLDVIPVRDLIERAVSQCTSDGAQLVTAVRVDVDATVDFIVADRQRLEQVLVQLVSNAVKFTPEGGHVEVTARPAPNAELHVSVSDSGIGILPDQIERIFDAFHQGTRLPADHVRAGTGLGLSLAKSFIEMHGGRIWVTSEPDEGSTFTIALPVLMTALRPLDVATRVGQ